MALIVDSVASAAGKFADWRNAAGERKLKLQELKLQHQANDWKDDMAVATMCGAFLIVFVLAPLAAGFGWIPAALPGAMAVAVNQGFSGGFGIAFGSILGAAVGLDKLGKGLAKVAREKK